MLPQFPLVGPRGRRPGCLRFRPELRGPCSLTYPVGAAPESGQGPVAPRPLWAKESSHRQGQPRVPARPPRKMTAGAGARGPATPATRLQGPHSREGPPGTSVFSHLRSPALRGLSLLRSPGQGAQEAAAGSVPEHPSPESVSVAGFCWISPSWPLWALWPVRCQGTPFRERWTRLSKPGCIQTPFNAREQGLEV